MIEKLLHRIGLKGGPTNVCNTVVDMCHTVLSNASANMKKVQLYSTVMKYLIVFRHDYISARGAAILKSSDE